MGSSQPDRRSFLAGLLAVGSAAVGVLLAVPLVRFTLHPVLARTTEKSWSDVGNVDEFRDLTAPVKKLVNIEQRDGWRKIILEKPVYVSKDAKGELIVLSAVCTHLGCAYHWDEGTRHFVCPCHTSAFGIDGKVLSGPAPRPLDRYQVRIAGNQLQIGPPAPHA